MAPEKLNRSLELWKHPKIGKYTGTLDVNVENILNQPINQIRKKWNKQSFDNLIILTKSINR